MAPAPTHLVVVCCHGIWLGGPSKARDESEWLVADFQRGEAPTFVRHIQAGVRCLARERQTSVLAFSGGSTRPETERSEARSYAEVAAANGYWGWLAAPVQHDDVLLEERALDSYHNILFSLTLFYSRFQAWPYRLTIISHAFKKPRLAGHCSAIGFPVQRLSLVGIDPPPAIISADGTKSEAMAGVKQAADQWADDPHGRGQDLASKRRRRNVWSVWQGLFLQGTLHQDKGGLVTRGEAEEETLVDDAPRPWP